MTEALLADRVAASNKSLQILKTDSKLIKNVKEKEKKRKEKYG
eukprot:CAMPEP_0206207016 /NCGR_PEP_ID=MMETSP0166-20121206/15333_1 /ASSEMBLY_ACC=CAM_ASM_000260 /TAXON_ID=95228 /ORGANISM="Vannella robusta, Strain DIVA3 518/3/11/1/6" /LENGTH=42 /DNA_ID= /DNA_START= /DNA_END= /DNA_ORIENTATION=